MSAKSLGRRFAVAATLLLATPPLTLLAQTQDGERSGSRSEIVRIRLGDPDAQIYQVFIDRKPVTVLYRKGAEVGLELAGGDDGVPCRHDVAVVTTDGRLADLPGVNLCDLDWVVAIDASRLSGGRAGSSSSTTTTSETPSAPEPSPTTADQAEGQAAQEDCGWLAIMTCRPDREAAERESTRIMGGISVIATDDYEGLDPGQFCAAQGPYSTHEEAEQNASFFRGKGAPDAYTQQACEAGPVSQDRAEGPGPGEGQDGRPSLAGGAGAAGREMSVSPGWSFTPPSDEDKTALLTFGNPSTGGLDFVAACAPDDENVALTLYRVPRGSAAGAQINAVLSTEAFQQRYRASIGEPDADTGLPTATVAVSAEDRLWDALAGHNRFYVDLGDRAGYDISLRGSAGPVREFIANCRGEAETVEAPADDRDDSAGSGAGGGPVPAAARYDCGRGLEIEVFFAGRGARASVSIDGDEPIILSRTGPGGAYRSGPYELRADAGGATWSDGEGRPMTCRAR